MKKTEWDYKLRLHRKPGRVRMDRLAAYMLEFAELLGLESNPVFKAIRNESTGVLSSINQDVKSQRRTMERLHAATTNPESKPARILRAIEALLGEDAIPGAELVNKADRVVYAFAPAVAVDDKTVRVFQEGTVDGTVTGLVGADDTMHLYVRDRLSRDLKIIVKDEVLAREVLGEFRASLVRLFIRGTWIRMENGWVPEASRCVLLRFEVLDTTPLSKIFNALAQLDGNGWTIEKEPLKAWEEIRGGD